MRIMYRAVLLTGGDSISKIFYSTVDAENWLDSQNNNMEHTSYVQELDPNYRVLDWYYYTQGR